MKYCPNCGDYALYDDDITVCPLCNKTLRTYIFEEEEVRYQEVNRPPTFEELQPERHEFRRTNGLYNEYHGSIVSVEHYHRIYPFFIKVIRSLFLNEPFQFGYLTYYTNIIIEENRYDALPESQVSLVYNGDIMGKVYAGEEVDIRTKVINKNRIASIRNSDSGQRVRPAFSIPGWMLWFTVLLIPVIVPMIISLGLAVLSALITPLCVLGILYVIIKSF